MTALGRAFCLVTAAMAVLTGCAAYPDEATTSAAADRPAITVLKPAQAPGENPPAWASTIQDQGFLY